MKKWLVSFLIVISAVSVSAAAADPRGVDSDVKGSVSSVTDRTRDVFKQQGIVQTGASSDDSGMQQTLKGKKGSMQVEVKLRSTGENETHVDVIAKQSELSWNKDFAQKLLSKIVQGG